MEVNSAIYQGGMQVLAPVGVSVYSRLDHLEQTIDALKSNTIATASKIYIFSDAPREGDEEAVQGVRAYARNIDGFDEVIVVERSENSRIHNNRGGMQYLLEKYGKLIWLEEDIVTGPGFLEFMNQALDCYRDADKVISITGYTPPIELPVDYRHDVFFLQRFNAWGFGTWKSKFEKIDLKIDENEYHLKMKDRGFYRKLVANGQDIPGMIDREVRGVIDALDVKIMYQQILHDWYTVHPRRSLVQNIGHDGSGLHCRVSDKFHHDELWGKTGIFNFPEEVQVDKRIVSANRNFRSVGIQGKFTELIRRFRSRLS